MAHKDFLYFRKLKEQLARQFSDSNPGINPDISSWKGKDIRDFQEDLERKANGRISEKWFYTHLKSDADKLPRVDILDLLSSYVGHENWQTFKNRNKVRKRSFYWLVIPGLIAIATAFLFITISGEQHYTFEVADAYTNERIEPDELRVIQLLASESPRELMPDKKGLFTVEASSDTIQFVVSAKYYYPDTIRRIVRRLSRYEIIRLLPNDYALMIHFYSKTDTNNWMQRRAQLSEIISDNARIFQVDPEGRLALELFNKHTFINKLTIPSNSLKNIDILDIRFDGDQITHLRFTQKEGGKNE